MKFFHIAYLMFKYSIFHILLLFVVAIVDYFILAYIIIYCGP